MSEKLSRKDFFRKSANYAGGIAAGIVGLELLANREGRGSTQTPWPWPYATLDPEAVRILGHDSFWSGNACCYAAFHAIIQSLREAVGEPYTDLPTELMIYGHGGAAGWGTICGALNGSSAAISLVCQKSDSDKLVHELNGWYTQAKFPSDESNEYAVNHTFTVNKFDQALPQNESGSPLCHVSVTEWCKAASHKVHDLERKERCARLAGDVAAQAVRILNDHFSGQFNSVYVPPPTIKACMACHGSTMIDNSITKMECGQCHGDPHATSAVNRPESIPSDFSVEQNYPNPFNPNTTIEFSLPKSERVSIAVYDLSGRHIKTLVNNRTLSAGKHYVQWDGTDKRGNQVPSGMYFYQFRAGKVRTAKSMMLVR